MKKILKLKPLIALILAGVFVAAYFVVNAVTAEYVADQQKGAAIMHMIGSGQLGAGLSSQQKKTFSSYSLSDSSRYQAILIAKYALLGFAGVFVLLAAVNGIYQSRRRRAQ